VLQVKILGQFDVRLNDKPVVIPSRAAQSLFAYLLLNAGTAFRREKLAGLLWPDTPEETARRNLRQELWRLRKVLEPDGSVYLHADDLTISFPLTEACWLDASVLERAAADDGPSGLMESLDAYQGELLPGFYDEWVTLERERLRALFEQKMQRLLERLAADERWADVLAWAERWIALGQRPEPAYRALLLAYGALGDMSKVAATFERCVAALRDDLGIEPSEQTLALYERLRAGGVAGKGATTPTSPHPTAEPAPPDDDAPAPGQPPFQGLQYFDEADADNFFGRERLTAKLVAHLRMHALLVVVGPSGSGKSSLVRAGLIPALKHGEPVFDGTLPPEGSARWPVYIITPTAHPLETLAVSLSRDSESVSAIATLMDDMARDPRSLRFTIRRAVELGAAAPRFLIVDQFEELFTLCRDEAERQAFVDSLLGAAAPEHSGLLKLVIALRADFYAHCAQYANLREAVATAQAYIGPMSAEELRRSIEEPAQRGGWAFESGLVDLILRDVGDEPGGLPLLSHALLETWKRRRGRTLTLKGYAECGGVRGAIAQTAETVFQQLTPERQAIARHIFIQLTELGEATQDTRRRVSIGELTSRAAEAPAVEAVLNILADARLLTVGEDTAEVAHEALIREWPTLREWLNQNREGLRLERRLSDATQEWIRLGRDNGALYRGVRLAQAQEWANAKAAELNSLELEFLDASRQALVREQGEREAQRQRELEAAQKLTAAERQHAERVEDERRIAFVRELSFAAVNNLEIDPERSILLALQAVAVSSAGGQPVLREAEEALHRAVGASRVQLTLRGHTGNVFSIAFSADGKRLATASSDKTAKVWDALTGKELLTLTGHTDSLLLNDVTFSPDGMRIATASFDKTAKVWDGLTGNELLTLSGHTDQLWGVAFSPDGTRLATASLDKTAKVWDAYTGKELLTLAGNTGGIVGIAFSPDGKRLVTGSWSDDTAHAARVWDAGTGKLLLTLTGHTDVVLGVTFSPDGKRLATGGPDTAARIWDSTTGQPLLALYAGGGITTVAFSPDGTRLSTRLTAGPTKMWNATTGQLLLTLVGSGGYGVAHSPDGIRLAAAENTTAKVWNISPAGGHDWLTLAGHSDAVTSVGYSLDGSRLATTSHDKTAKIWDALTGRNLLTLSHAAVVDDVAFSRDGSRLATTSRDQSAQVWDAATGKPLLSIPTASVPSATPHRVAFSPDGRRVATASAGGTARVWDACSGEVLLTLSCHSATVLGIAFSPDGMRLATSSLDSTAKVWDASTGKELLTLSGHSSLVPAVVFSHDGQRIATSSFDGTAKEWDAASGKLLLTLSSDAGILRNVAFSPDGTHLATAGGDGTLRVWDVSAGSARSAQPLTLYNPTAQSLWGVAYSPDGQRVASASIDGTVPIFDLSLAVTIANAKTRVTRSLTSDECQKYLHVEKCP
jgi:WD40 repeat protein/DNA-binding SARP family transcriptional activator/energy-coupling factor transporter ATP-binding protein EcfA2